MRISVSVPRILLGIVFLDIFQTAFGPINVHTSDPLRISECQLHNMNQNSDEKRKDLKFFVEIFDQRSSYCLSNLKFNKLINRNKSNFLKSFNN